jgi:hypothetical protein
MFFIEEFKFKNWLNKTSFLKDRVRDGTNFIRHFFILRKHLGVINQPTARFARRKGECDSFFRLYPKNESPLLFLARFARKKDAKMGFYQVVTILL